MKYKIRYGRVIPHPKVKFSTVKVELETEIEIATGTDEFRNSPSNYISKTLALHMIELAQDVEMLCKMGVRNSIEITQNTEVSDRGRDS